MLSLSQWALRGESDCDDMHGAEYIYVYKYMYREMFLCEFHNGHCVGEARDCDDIHSAEYIYINIYV